MGMFDYEIEEEQDLSAAELVNNESLKNLNSKNRTKKLKQNIFYLALAVVLLGLSIIIGTSFFFKLKSIEVRGNTRYTVSEIASVCELNGRTNILFIDSIGIKRKLKETYPYIESVSIKKTYPDKVVITIEEDSAEWYSQIWGEWFVLSGDLRVMEKISNPESYADIGNLKWLKLPEIDYAVTGNKIVFSKPSTYEYTLSFLNNLEQMHIFSSLEFIDCSDRYHISLYMNENRFKLIIGDSDNVEAKLSLIDKIISDSGEITMTSVYSFNAEYISPVIVAKGEELYVYG